MLASILVRCRKCGSNAMFVFQHCGSHDVFVLHWFCAPGVWDIPARLLCVSDCIEMTTFAFDVCQVCFKLEEKSRLLGERDTNQDLFVSFRTSQPPNILFSYKAQVDDGADEDSVSLPHQIYSPTGRPEGHGKCLSPHQMRRSMEACLVMRKRYVDVNWGPGRR